MSVDVRKVVVETVCTQVFQLDMLGLALSLESLKKTGTDFSYVDAHSSIVDAAALYAEMHNRWDPNMVEFLIENGAQVTAGDVSSLFHWPQSFSLPGIMNIAKKHFTLADVKAKNTFECPLIIQAVHEGCLEFIQLYHDLGGDIRAKFDKGQSLLMFAFIAARDNSATIDLLIKLGASLTDTDQEGNSVFLHACDKVEYLKVLQKHGLVLAPEKTMVGNLELQVALYKCTVRNNRRQYEDLVVLAQQNQPSLVIPSFEEVKNSQVCREEYVQAYMVGNFSIGVKAREQKVAIIRRTKNALALQKTLSPTVWEEVMKLTFQYLNDVASHIFKDNTNYLLKAVRLLSVSGQPHVRDCLANSKNIIPLFKNITFAEIDSTIFEE